VKYNHSFACQLCGDLLSAATQCSRNHPEDGPSLAHCRDCHGDFRDYLEGLFIGPLLPAPAGEPESARSAWDAPGTPCLDPKDYRNSV
jgi:hypothetical protein